MILLNILNVPICLIFTVNLVFQLQDEDDLSPKKRERTRSDPARQSKEVENTAL